MRWKENVNNNTLIITIMVMKIEIRRIILSLQKLPLLSKGKSSFFGKAENKLTGESFRLIPKYYKLLRCFLSFASFIGEI